MMYIIKVTKDGIVFPRNIELGNYELVPLKKEVNFDDEENKEELSISQLVHTVKGNTLRALHAFSRECYNSKFHDGKFNYEYLSDIVYLSDEDLLKIRGINIISAAYLIIFLEKYGVNVDITNQEVKMKLEEIRV